MFRLSQPLWLDALYLRLRDSRFFKSHVLDARGEGVLYATRMTVQGSGLPGANSSALWISQGAQAYIEGVDALG